MIGGVSILVIGVSALLLAMRARSRAAQTTAAVTLACGCATVLMTAANSDLEHVADLVVVAGAVAAITSFLLALASRPRSGDDAVVRKGS